MINKLDLQASVVFQKNFEALSSDVRFIVNQGSSRSSKTYSICQVLILHALQFPNKTISIIRKTFPTLRATVMRDFFEILKEMDIYERDNHNKTENIYTFKNGSMVEFFSADDEQKIRGRKRDIAWVNEANELCYDEFLQLNMRTTDKLIFDYNPSDASSWLYELPDDEMTLIKSTYKDNPFLETAIIKQIENLKTTDEALWSIYGLGERSMSRKNIWSNWTFVDERPPQFEDYIYGIDFGFNHVTSLVKVWYTNEMELYPEILIYESYLTTSQLIERFKTLGIEDTIEIMADYSRPEIIEEFKQAGYDMRNANKSVKQGINNVKTFTVYVPNDARIKKEYENYMWKKVGDLILDEPVKIYDDFSDSLRYAVYEIKDNKIDNDEMITFHF